MKRIIGKKSGKERSLLLFFVFGILAVKITLMVCFSSDYQDGMFFPFVNQFINGLGTREWNPWEYYSHTGLVSSFPYPPLMLLIESVPVLLIRLFHAWGLFAGRFLFRLPILIFDCLCVFVLARMFPGKKRYIIVLYFVSPIILYSGYMHGQLDVIPTTLLVCAISVLIRKKRGYQWWFGILMAAAVLTKQHTLAAAPLLFLFMGKRDGWKRVFQAVAVFTVSIAALVLPFWSPGFYRQVICNQEQMLLMKVFLDYGQIKVILPVLALLIIYLRAFFIDKINQKLLLGLCGGLFAVFLILVPPMPGWYTWVVPFITVFFIDFGLERYKNLLLYVVWNISYLCYFVFFHRAGQTDLYLLRYSLDFIKIENTVLQNLIFTCMTGCLIIIAYQMYQKGIASNSFYKRGNLPFLIGISGDSGSGKSCMLELINSLLGRKEVLEIEGDGDHKWERGEEMWNSYTHLDPRANFLYRQALDLQMLREGKNVYRVEYDHSTGKFSEKHRVVPRKYIVVCGLHSLYLPQMRRSLDLKIYMDTEETLRCYWKIQRDIGIRGYSPEKILQQIQKRQADSEKYIAPQKKYADLVIQYLDTGLKDCWIQGYTPSISIRFTLSAAINLENLIQLLCEEGIEVQWEIDGDLDKQTLLVDGSTLRQSCLDAEKIAERIIPQLEEITVTKFSKNPEEGIRELFLLLAISYKMRGEVQ